MSRKTMYPDRNGTQFWVIIPDGQTASEFRRAIKLAAITSNVSVQQFISDAIQQHIERQLKANSKT